MTGAQHDNIPHETPWQRLTHDAKRELVRQAVQHDQLTYAQAAVRLGASRVAIAGVVERSKRSPNPIVSNSGQGSTQARKRSAAKARAHKKPRPITGNRKKKTYAPPQKTTRKSGFNVMPEYLTHNADPTPYRADLWEVLPGAAPVAVADHHEGCRFPHGDGPFTFCALPVKPGSSYCPEHDTICYRGSLHTTPKQLLAAPVRRTGVNMTASVDADFG